MPYDTLDYLPEGVRNALPKHAQEICRAAFIHAWDAFQDPSDRKSGASREETVHKLAWAAVKQQYKKSGDQWHEKP